MNLVDRVKNIILAPAAEWIVIEPEVTTVKELYLSYVVILAAISPIASFIGTTVFGIHAGFGLVIRQSFLTGLVLMIVGYVVVLTMVYVFSLVIDFVAPKFGGLKNPMQAFKFAAYSLTPGMVAGVFNIIPQLSILGLLAGLYGIYVFVLGAPGMMKVPRDKVPPYTAVVIVTMIVIGIVVGAVWGVIGYSTGAGMLTASSRSTNTANDVRAEIIAAQIAAAANQAQVNSNVNATTPTTTTVAPANQAAATGNAIAAMAAAAGNGAQIDPVDKEVLKGMLPDTVGGLPRNSVEASRSGIANMQVAIADANYGDGQKRMDLKVTDMGGAKMLGLAAAWAMVDVDQSSDHGYEKTGKVNGRPTHEKFDKNGPNGEYAVLVGDRFVVEADGNVDMSVLKDGVAAIDVNKLEAMKNQGVH